MNFRPSQASFPSWVPQPLISMALSCLQRSPEDRPTANSLLSNHRLRKQAVELGLIQDASAARAPAATPPSSSSPLPSSWSSQPVVVRVARPVSGSRVRGKNRQAEIDHHQPRKVAVAAAAANPKTVSVVKRGGGASSVPVATSTQRRREVEEVVSLPDVVVPAPSPRRQWERPSTASSSPLVLPFVPETGEPEKEKQEEEEEEEEEDDDRLGEKFGESTLVQWSVTDSTPEGHQVEDQKRRSAAEVLSRLHEIQAAAQALRAECEEALGARAASDLIQFITKNKDLSEDDLAKFFYTRASMGHDHILEKLFKFVFLQDEAQRVEQSLERIIP